MPQREVDRIPGNNEPFFLLGRTEQGYQVEQPTRLFEVALPCDVTATRQIAKLVFLRTENANRQMRVMEKVLHIVGTDLYEGT